MHQPTNPAQPNPQKQTKKQLLDAVDGHGDHAVPRVGALFLPRRRRLHGRVRGAALPVVGDGVVHGGGVPGHGAVRDAAADDLLLLDRRQRLDERAGARGGLAFCTAGGRQPGLVPHQPGQQRRREPGLPARLRAARGALPVAQPARDPAGVGRGAAGAKGRQAEVRACRFCVFLFVGVCAVVGARLCFCLCGRIGACLPVASPFKPNLLPTSTIARPPPPNKTPKRKTAAPRCCCCCPSTTRRLSRPTRRPRRPRTSRAPPRPPQGCCPRS